MFTYAELVELEDLCKTDERFEKFIVLLQEENTDLLSKISHEIGNPLTIIYSTMQLMELRNPEICMTKYWRQLSDDVRDLVQLLHHYSTYSNCDSLTVREVDFANLISEVVHSFEPVLYQNNIQCSCHISETMHNIMKTIPCDQVKIKQVVTNIIKNAMEALEDKGSLWICVPDKDTQIESFRQGDKYLILQIGNDGFPIPESEQKKMFSPIHSDKAGGLGIGLSISNKIIKAHEGKIFVNSVKAKTEFTICLPID